MNLDLFIEAYKKTNSISSNAHLNWLKENVNPVLYEIDPNLNITWACSNCVKNYMNMLVGWYDRKLEAERQADLLDKKKRQPKKPRKPRKTVAKEIRVKNK